MKYCDRTTPRLSAGECHLKFERVDVIFYGNSAWFALVFYRFRECRANATFLLARGSEGDAFLTKYICTFSAAPIRISVGRLMMTRCKKDVQTQ